MNSLTATIEHWAAWAPGIESPSAWRQWARGDIALADDALPDVGFLPAMFRRRLSRLSKMALKVAFECGQQHTPLHTVFCSRHGELGYSKELLDAITANEALSPTAFSMSVHNTASGLFSIASRDTSGSSAIAAGADSLEAGFLDAASMLASGATDRVMLVAGDEPPPAPFSEIVEEKIPPYAAAFLLSNKKEGACRLSLGLAPDPEDEPRDEPHTLSLLRLLIQDEARALVFKRPGLNWVWSKHAVTH